MKSFILKNSEYNRGAFLNIFSRKKDMNISLKKTWDLWLSLGILIGLTILVTSGEEPTFFWALNTVFHEAGHPLFSIFGVTWGYLGGTIMQLLIPCICAFGFFLKKEWLGICCMVWWFGEQLLGVGKYMGDARIRELPLLGGGTDGHDWAYLFTNWNVLEWSEFMGKGVGELGVFLMYISVGGVVFLFYKRRYSGQQNKEPL